MPSLPGQGAGRPRKPLAIRLHDGSFTHRIPKADRIEIAQSAEARRTGRFDQRFTTAPQDSGDRWDVPRVVAIDPPGILSPEAHADWRALIPQALAMGVVETQDETALIMLAETSAQVRQLRAIVAREGSTYVNTTRDGVQYKARPEATQLIHAQRQLLVMLNMFGLTPSGRASLNVGPIDPLNGKGDIVPD